MSKDLNPIEKKICEKIQRFDIHALLQLLRSIGYTRDEILFKSDMSMASPNSLLSDIKFYLRPVKRAIIRVNLGLFSHHTPLPSYFRKVIEIENIDEKSLIDFIEFFDHKLIEHYLDSIYPEYDRALYADWEKTVRSYLMLLELKSPSILHHIFQLLFPELGVEITKSGHKRRLQAGEFRLGKTIIGDTPVLGGQATVNVPGFDITLYSDYEHDEVGKPWVDIIAGRIEKSIFSVLKDVEIHLKILLVIRSQKGWVQLRKRGYLGVDRIRGEREKNRTVVIFQGQVHYL